MSYDKELYEFDASYVGRKTYVSVKGHSRSIPKYKTYKGTDGRNYLRPEYGGDWSGVGGQSAYLMPDKPGYVSPMSGDFVEGRAAHREHMNVHNVVEAGDMPIGGMSKGRNNAPLPDVRDSIKQSLEQVRSR